MKRKIPFVGGSNPRRSMNADAERSLNCYVELDNTADRAPMALYGTPGTVVQLTLPTLGGRGLITAGGYTYAVYGTVAYKISGATYTALGVILGSGLVSMASNGIQILIVNGLGGYIITLATGVLTQITDVDFPVGVKQCTYQDGYFLVTGDGTGKFYISNILAGASWVGTEFASAEGSPDNTIGIFSIHREIWLFGTSSIEIWVDTGNSSFPFERSGNVFIEHGCASSNTIAKLDNTLFWLGTDDYGAIVVWRANGYTPGRVSTHGMERLFESYTTSDAFAFAYTQEGHGFYVLTFPTSSKTWVYDVASQEWAERAYMLPSDSSLIRWRPNCYTFNGTNHLVGDFQTGDIYKLDLETYTDNGASILRLRATQPLENAQDRLPYDVLQVDMETGVGLNSGQGINPVLMMRYSNDGGHTWSALKSASIGPIGKYGKRAIFRRNGIGRNRVWEISMTDPVKFAVFGAVVTG